MATGTGAAQAQAASAAGVATGGQPFTGGGTPNAQAASAAGVGTGGAAFTGTGTPQAQAATVAGVGTVVQVVTGYDGDYIPDLDITRPVAGDPNQPQATYEWDDAMREVKRVLKNNFSGFAGASVTVTEAEINSIVDRVLRAGDTMTGRFFTFATCRYPITDPEIVPKCYVVDLGTPTPGDPYPCGFTGIFEIPATSLTLDTVTQWAHSLSDNPDIVHVALENKVAQHGYEAGDRIKIGVANSNDTDTSLEVGGITRFSNETNIGVSIGSHVWVLDKATGTHSEITPTRWDLTGMVVAVTCSVPPCTPATVDYEELDDVKGELQNIAMDRTNDVVLSWHTGTGSLDTPIFVSVNALTNDFLQRVDGNAAGTANRSYGWIFSSQGNGVIDRYVFGFRVGDPGTLLFYIYVASTFNGGSGVTHAYGYGFLNGDNLMAKGVETVDYCAFAQDTQIQAWEKNVYSVGQVTVVNQTSTLASHTYDSQCLPANMPDKTFFMQSWKTDGGFWAFGPFTPNGAGGIITAPVASTIPHASRALVGSTYDGTNVWYAYYYTDVVVKNHLLKLDLDGNVVTDYYLGDFGATGGDDNWHTLDYDPVSGKIAMFWGDGNVHFFDSSTGSFSTQAIAAGASSGLQKYNGTACSVYTTKDYDFGAGDKLASAKSCVICV